MKQVKIVEGCTRGTERPVGEVWQGLLIVSDTHARLSNIAVETNTLKKTEEFVSKGKLWSKEACGIGIRCLLRTQMKQRQQ